MTDLYFFILTAINLFVLLFMCVLIHLSENLKPRQARGFQITFILIGCISILEMISVLVNDGPVWLRWLNILSNYLGFGLTPAVPVCLIYTLQSSDRISAGLKVAAVMEILYFLLLTVSIFTGGLVFAVDEANHYSRQNGFQIYMVMYYAGIAYLMFCSLEMARNFQNRGRELIYGLAGFLAAGTLVQILIPEIHITWLCVTLIAVLYFLYCNEMWNQLDGLTGLLSQKSYINRTLNLRPEDRMLIVLDLDDFKYINDTYGHLAGDRCLKEIARCLKQAYSSYGNCYRIGGDEFCVLLQELEKEELCKEKLLWLMEKRRKVVSNQPFVSYGSAEIMENECIRDTKIRADQKMYEDKKEHKERKCR